MADFKNLLVLACAGLNGSFTHLVFLVVVFSLNQDLCIGCLAACFANVSDSFFLLLCSVYIGNLAHASWYEQYFAPKITANALFCTLSICVEFSCVSPEVQTTAENSRTLLTCWQYTSSRVWVEAPIILSLFIIHSLPLVYTRDHQWLSLIHIWRCRRRG